MLTRTKIVPLVALALVLAFSLTVCAEELPSSYFNYKLGKGFVPSKDKPALKEGEEGCSRYNYPKWKGGTTWGLETYKKGKAYGGPYPLAIEKKKSYKVRGEISVGESGGITIITVITRVAPKEHSWEAVEKSLMEAYGGAFYEKKEMSGGISNTLKFKDDEKELWVTYGDGARELEVKIFKRRKDE